MSTTAVIRLFVASRVADEEDAHPGVSLLASSLKKERERAKAREGEKERGIENGPRDALARETERERGSETCALTHVRTQERWKRSSIYGHLCQSPVVAIYRQCSRW